MLGFVGDAAKWVGKAVKTAGKAAGSVPVVGDGLKAVVDITLDPIALTADIASGGRIDRVALRSLKRNINGAKAIAPYAASVISFVPGVGTGVAGAISAGAALAEGKSIDKAMVEGIKGAVPGGKVAQSVYDVSQAVIAGKTIEQVGVAALPITSQQKQLLSSALKVTRAIAEGKKVDKTVINEAMRNLPSAAVNAIKKAGGSKQLDELVKQVQSKLPKEVKKAVQIGMAVGVAQTIQAKERQRAKTLVAKLPFVGTKIIKPSSSLNAAASMLNNQEKKGLAVGVGLMNFKINGRDFMAVRKALAGPERKGFDIAVSTHIGRVETKGKPPPQVFSWDDLAAAAKAAQGKKQLKKPKREMNAHEKAAYYAAVGMKGATQEQKVGMLKTVTNKKTAGAIKEAIKHNDNLWRKLLDYLGIGN